MKFRGAMIFEEYKYKCDELKIFPYTIASSVFRLQLKIFSTLQKIDTNTMITDFLILFITIMNESFLMYKLKCSIFREKEGYRATSHPVSGIPSQARRRKDESLLHSLRILQKLKVSQLSLFPP